MEKILIIGSPGSGKSTLSFALSKILNMPILHLDRIFHIDNYHSISRSDLLSKINAFIFKNDRYIIDGNYGSTLKERLNHSDTVIVMDFDPKLCLENIEKRRLSKKKRPDMAPGFDNTIRDEAFYDYVGQFKTKNFPKIITILSDYQDVDQIYLHNYNEVNNFINTLIKEGN